MDKVERRGTADKIMYEISLLPCHLQPWRY